MSAFISSNAATVKPDTEQSTLENNATSENLPPVAAQTGVKWPSTIVEIDQEIARLEAAKKGDISQTGGDLAGEDITVTLADKNIASLAQASQADLAAEFIARHRAQAVREATQWLKVENDLRKASYLKVAALLPRGQETSPESQVADIISERDSLKSDLDAAKAQIVELRDAATLFRSIVRIMAMDDGEEAIWDKAKAILARTAADYASPFSVLAPKSSS